jgi:hypothetical protein
VTKTPYPQAGRLISDEYQRTHEPDRLSQRLREHVNDYAGDVDLAKLRAFAEANDIWRDSDAALNVGKQFMDISNRLHGLVRNGGKVKWE